MSAAHGLRAAIGGVLSNAFNFPEKVQTRLLGQNMGPLIEKVTEAVLPEVERLTAERDAALAVIEKARRALRSPLRATYSDLVAVAEALASVDTSALAARDAETRREALLVAATDADARGDIGCHHPGCPTAGDWLRAIAEKEGVTT